MAAATPTELTGVERKAIAADLETIRAQEDALVFSHFDADVALQLGLALRDAALAQQVAVTIDIRQGDNILFFHAMPGTAPANADWARRKRNVVELLRRSSYAVGLEIRLTGDPLDGKMALPLRDYAAHGGCFPIRVTGAGHCGTVTVSGLPQREDHKLVVGVLAQMLGKDLAVLKLD
ncbi:MAG TPA: heme-degrading domain-containing protein [Terriglobia bacterium]|nr:heme-degrading domain-containing protein [Terriglobia bacterium]